MNSRDSEKSEPPEDTNSNSSNNSDSFNWLDTEQIYTFLNSYVIYGDTPQQQEELFQEYIRETTIPIFKIVLLAIGALIALAWPTDFFVFDDPLIIQSYIIWRSCVLTIIIFGLLGVQYTQFCRRHINLVIVLSSALSFAVVAFSIARFGGMKGPFFYVIYFSPWMTMLLGLGFFKRLLSTILITFSYGAAYTLPFPEYLGYKRLPVPIIMAGCGVILSTICGHLLYHVIRENFFNQRALKQKQDKLQKQRKKLEYVASHDQLTGLLNRRHFEDRFEEEFERSVRYESPISIMMIDLDHFKDINDTYGHPAGDRVLESTGELIRTDSRRSDIAGRYGGEEFCVILPETDIDGSDVIAERIRTAMSDQTFESDEGSEFTITCSIGLTELKKSDNTPQDLLKRADEALYEAKESGRNQIVKKT